MTSLLHSLVTDTAPFAPVLFLFAC